MKNYIQIKAITTKNKICTFKGKFEKAGIFLHSILGYK